jgi:AraC-like DNA-binding protein
MDDARRAARLHALGRYLRSAPGRAQSASTVADLFHLDVVYVSGVRWELDRRERLAAMVTIPGGFMPPPPCAPDAGSVEYRIAQLDRYLRDQPGDDESIARLALRFNLSRPLVRRRLRTAGWALLEYARPRHPPTDEEQHAEYITTIMAAYRHGVSIEDIGHHLHQGRDVVELIIEQQRVSVDVPDL